MLTQNILSYAQLDRFEFGEKFSYLEPKLDWLMRWTGRSHVTCEEDKFSVRLKVHPRMIIYALWLIEKEAGENPLESKVREDPFMKTQGFIPSTDYRTIVAYPVSGGRVPKSPRGSKNGKKPKVRKASSASTDDDLTSVSALDTQRSNFTDFLDSDREISRNLTNDDVQNFMTKEASESDMTSGESGVRDQNEQLVRIGPGYRKKLIQNPVESSPNNKSQKKLSELLMIRDESDRTDEVEPISTQRTMSTKSMSSEDDIPFERTGMMKTIRQPVISEYSHESSSLTETGSRESEKAPERLDDLMETKVKAENISVPKPQFEFKPRESNLGQTIPGISQQTMPNPLVQPQIGNFFSTQPLNQLPPNMFHQPTNLTEQMQYVVRNELASFIHAQQQSFMLMLNAMQPSANRMPPQRPVEQQTQTETDNFQDDKPLRLEELNRSSNNKISIQSALNELNELKEINQNLALPLLSISKQSESKKMEKRQPFENLMNRLSEFNKSFGSKERTTLLRIPAEKESDALPKFWSSMPSTDGKPVDIQRSEHFSMSGPLPLLHIEKSPTKTFSNIEDSRGFLRLIPMKEVAAFENHKRIQEDIKYANLHGKGKKELWKVLEEEARQHAELTPFKLEDTASFQQENVEMEPPKSSRREKLFVKEKQIPSVSCLLA